MPTKLLQSCLTLWDPMDCSLPGSSVHETLQARILEWVAKLSSGDLPDPGIEPTSLVSPALAGGFFTTSGTLETSCNQSWENWICWQVTEPAHSNQELGTKEGRNKRKNTHLRCQILQPAQVSNNVPVTLRIATVTSKFKAQPSYKL